MAAPGYPQSLRGKGFPKGKSGNPGGMSKLCDKTVKEIRKRMPELVDELFSIAFTNKKANNRIRAIELLVAYAIGRPSQKLELNGTMASVTRVIHEALAPIEWEARWAQARLAAQETPLIAVNGSSEDQPLEAMPASDRDSAQH